MKPMFRAVVLRDTLGQFFVDGQYILVKKGEIVTWVKPTVYDEAKTPFAKDVSKVRVRLQNGGDTYLEKNAIEFLADRWDSPVF